MPSTNTYVHVIFSAAVACSSSTATRRSATRPSVRAGRSVRRAAGNARLLAFGRNRDPRGQIPLRRGGGCWWGGGGGGRGEKWGRFACGPRAGCGFFCGRR